jgi:hypothetical protein
MFFLASRSKYYSTIALEADDEICCKVARSRKTSGRADDQDEEKEIVTRIQ